MSSLTKKHENSGNGTEEEKVDQASESERGWALEGGEESCRCM